MIGLIILMFGAVGVLILHLSFKQLTAIRILYPIMDWHHRIVRTILCFAGFASGSVLVLLFIFIPAAFGNDMDVALFTFIFAMPFFAYRSLFVNKL